MVYIIALTAVLKLLFIASFIVCVSEFCLPTELINSKFRLTDFTHIYAVEKRKVFVGDRCEKIRSDSA